MRCCRLRSRLASTTCSPGPWLEARRNTLSISFCDYVLGEMLLRLIWTSDAWDVHKPKATQALSFLCSDRVEAGRKRVREHGTSEYETETGANSKRAKLDNGPLCMPHAGAAASRDGENTRVLSHPETKRTRSIPQGKELRLKGGVNTLDPTGPALPLSLSPRRALSGSHGDADSSIGMNLTRKQRCAILTTGISKTQSETLRKC